MRIRIQWVAVAVILSMVAALIGLTTVTASASGPSLGSGKSTVKLTPGSEGVVNTELDHGALVVSGLPSQTVRVVASVGAGTLHLTHTAGISAPTGYPATFSGAEIAFVGTTAAVNAALASLTYRAPATAGTHTIKVSAAAIDRAGVSYDPTNGHYYEYVPWNGTPSNWQTARTAAATSTYLGMSGYLATITSQNENAFATSKIGSNGAWIGGTDELVEGEWRWADGPEANQLFWRPSCGVSLKGTCPATGMFNYWSTFEPNNSGSSGEDYLQYMGGATGEWNDLRVDWSQVTGRYAVLGYVVEYSTPDGAPNPNVSVERDISAVVGEFAQPVILKAAGGECHVSLEWTKPVNHLPVTGYTVEYRADGATWDPRSEHASSTTHTTVSHLTAGVWHFRVAANDSAGRNGWSDPVTATVHCGSPAPSPTSSPTSSPTPTPTPTPRPDTPVTVEKVHRGKTVPLGRPTTLVVARTKGTFTKARVTCRLHGNKVPPGLRDRLCGTRVALGKGRKKATVTARPTCTRGLRIGVELTAKQPGDARTRWTRSWRVRSGSAVTCRLKGTG